MANNTAKNNHGQIIHEWQFAEFHKYQRGLGWYILSVGISVGLVVWAIIDRNVLFAIIILITAVLYFALSRREPTRLTISVAEDGIMVGQNFYPYSECKNFWLFYRPPDLKKLYIHFKTALRPSLVIPLERQNPVTLRQTLLRFLPEDLEQEEEPASDELSRILKI